MSLSTLRVRFAETDQMGVAHHSSYVVWLELARVDWLREQGLSYKQMDAEGISLAVSELSVQYRSSVAFDDELVVETRLTEARSRRFCFSYNLRQGDKIVALATTVHTPVDQTGRAIRLPVHWFEKLQTPAIKDASMNLKER